LLHAALILFLVVRGRELLDTRARTQGWPGGGGGGGGGAGPGGGKGTSSALPRGAPPQRSRSPPPPTRPPPIPSRSRLCGCAGPPTRVRFWLSAEGRVTRPDMDRRSASAHYGREFRQGMMAYQFYPARTRDRRSVPSVVTVPVRIGN